LGFLETSAHPTDEIDDNKIANDDRTSFDNLDVK
jgi:hypothetical protein